MTPGSRIRDRLLNQQYVHLFLHFVELFIHLFFHLLKLLFHMVHPLAHSSHLHHHYLDFCLRQLLVHDNSCTSQCDSNAQNLFEFIIKNLPIPFTQTIYKQIRRNVCVGGVGRLGENARRCKMKKILLSIRHDYM